MIWMTKDEAERYRTKQLNCILCDRGIPMSTVTKYPIKLSDYADMFTMDEFVAQVQKLCFIPYDGTGHYSDGVGMSREHVDISNKGIHIDRSHSHVAWFNR